MSEQEWADLTDSLRAALTKSEVRCKRIRVDTLAEVLQRIDATKAGSGPQDGANDVWQEACDTVATLVRNMGGKEGG